MTFFKVQDPKNKDLIKEYIAKRNRVRETDRNEKKWGDLSKWKS